MTSLFFIPFVRYLKRDATFPLQGQNMYPFNEQGATWVSLTEQIVIISKFSICFLFHSK